MLDNKILLAHSLYINQGIFALLLGSGISRSSGIPTGWDIVIDLIKRIAVLEREDCGADPVKWYHARFKEFPHYSNLLERLTFSSEERVNLLRPYFEPTEEELAGGLKQPTIAHRSIAQLVKKGYVKMIITTNFDRLMENALSEVGVVPTVISNPSHIENVLPIIHSNATVIKINGDYLDSQFLNLQNELSRYDQKIVELGKRVFEDFGLVTSGWSAKWDIGLSEILKSANKFRFGNYFTYINLVDKELENLALLRRGKLIPITSADNFFMEVTENIEALENYEIHPLTKEIAIARLKKYIGNSSFKVQLYDLFNNEVKKTQEEVYDDFNYSHPTHVLLKENIEFYLLRMDTLVALLISGVYWGETYHEKFWTKAIIQMASPKMPQQNYGAWNNLQFFPATFMIYAAGLTALATNNLKYLSTILSLKLLDRNGEKKTIIYNCNPTSVAEPKDLRIAYKNDKYVPMNEIFYEAFKSKLQPYIASEQEYDRLFDYFEIILALFYLKIAGLRGFPLGRFKYRRNHYDLFNTLYTDIKETEERHELIIHGLFDYQTLLSCFDHIRERVNNMRE